MSNAREIILTKVKNALQKGKVNKPFPDVNTAVENVFSADNSKQLAHTFAEEFTKLGGHFFYCKNKHEMLGHLNQLVHSKDWQTVHCVEPELTNFFAEQNVSYISDTNNFANLYAAITYCQNLVARTGSLILTSADASGRSLSVYTPVHICVAYNKQLVHNIIDATQQVQNKFNNNLPSVISLATGPSRTADIEKTLVVGVHGPKEVYVFLIEE